MNILVTGGLGFIGTRLVCRLLQPGDIPDPHITVLDLPEAPIPPPLKEPIGQERVTVARGSALDADLVNRLVRRADEVYHLAAVVGVKQVMRDPQRVIKVNFGGAATVVDAATEHQTPLLMVSSSEVAGKYRGSPFSEDTDRLIGSTAQLRWTYAEAKALAEQYALAAHRQHGLPVVIVRPFNVVGPGQTADNGMVIPTFFRQALSGEPITVIGDGSQHRSFSYVDDVVEAFVNLLREPRAHGLVVNVGADQPVSILELAQRIRRLTRSSSPITFVSYEEAYGLSSGKVDDTQETPEAAEALAHWGAEVLEAGALEGEVLEVGQPKPAFRDDFHPDIAFRVPNLARARNLIGYAPQTSLDTILREFFAHLQTSTTYTTYQEDCQRDC